MKTGCVGLIFGNRERLVYLLKGCRMVYLKVLKYFLVSWRSG